MQHLLFRDRRKDTTDSCCSRQAAGSKSHLLDQLRGWRRREKDTQCFNHTVPALPLSTGLHYSYTAVILLLHLHCPTAIHFGVAFQRHLSFCNKFFSPNPSPFRNLQYLLAYSFSLLVWHRRLFPYLPAFSLCFFLHRLSPPLFIQILPQNSPSEQARSTLCDKAHCYRYRFTRLVPYPKALCIPA